MQSINHLAKYSAIFLIFKIIAFSIAAEAGIFLSMTSGIAFDSSSNVFLVVYFIILAIGCTAIFYNQALDSPINPYISGLIIAAFFTLFFPIIDLIISFKSSIMFLVRMKDEKSFKEVMYILICIAPLILCALATVIAIKNKKSKLIENESVPFYLSIPVKTLIKNYVLTFGWYRYYWWYQNWKLHSLRYDRKISPFWRCLFPVFFYYEFMRGINEKADECQSSGIKRPKLLMMIYIVYILIVIIMSFGFDDKISYPILLASYVIIALSFNILLLLPLQTSINQLRPLQTSINQLSPNFYKKFDNKKISLIILLLVMVGALSWVDFVGIIARSSRSDARNAEIYLDYLKVKPAFIFAQKAAKNGDVKGQYVLGKLYMLGVGVDKDTEQGIHWLELSANQGNDNAQYLLGNIYHYGSDNIEKDIKKAVYWYQKAVASGNGEAATNLGFLYESGQGVKKDENKALELYKIAASKNDDVAMYNIGLYYKTNKTIPNHFVLAKEWFKKSLKTSKNFNTCSANDLGLMFAAGDGIKADTLKADYYFRQTIKSIEYTKSSQFEIDMQDVNIFSDKLLNSFSEYQIAKASKKNIDAMLRNKYPSNVVNVAEELSDKIESVCWS